jgi:hypothetical protein
LSEVKWFDNEPQVPKSDQPKSEGYTNTFLLFSIIP